MAYMSQENKRKLAPGIQSVLKKYGIKGSIRVRNHSTLCVNISSGSMDFSHSHDDKYTQVNVYHIKRYYEGQQRAFLEELYAAMSIGNFDNSDASVDYFHVGWYNNINIGQWNKPYKFVANTQQ